MLLVDHLQVVQGKQVTESALDLATVAGRSSELHAHWQRKSEVICPLHVVTMELERIDELGLGFFF